MQLNVEFAFNTHALTGFACSASLTLFSDDALGNSTVVNATNTPPDLLPDTTGLNSTQIASVDGAANGS